MSTTHLAGKVASQIALSSSVGGYWADGDVQAAPLPANYSPAPEIVDGDNNTKVTSLSDTITALRVTSAGLITTLNIRLSYKGAITKEEFDYWDGAAWQPMTDISGTSWGVLGAYGQAIRAAEFSGVPSASIFRCCWTHSDNSGGFIACNELEELF